MRFGLTTEDGCSIDEWIIAAPNECERRRDLLLESSGAVLVAA